MIGWKDGDALYESGVIYYLLRRWIESGIVEYWIGISDAYRNFHDLNSLTSS